MTPWTITIHSPWNSPGQNTAVGSLSFLQGIFPTQELNPGLLHKNCRQILTSWATKEAKQLTYITHMWNLKHDTNDQNKNRLTDIENKLLVNKDERDGVGTDKLESGLIYTLLYTKEIIHTDLLYNPGNNTQCVVIYDRKEHTYTHISLCCTPEINTTL